MASDENIAFEIVRGQPVAIFPVPGREVNGTTIINLQDCVSRHGGTIDERREQWLAAWGRYVTDDVGSEPPSERDAIVAERVGWDVTRQNFFSHIENDKHWAFIQNFLREHRVPAKEIGAKIEIDEYTDKEFVQIICKIAVIRRMADRSGKRIGESQPEFMDTAGNWTPWPWMNEEFPPVAARVKIYRSDCPEPFTGLAEWKRCVQFTRDGNDNVVMTKAWAGANGPFQLGRCASASGHRLAFPDAVGQTYSDDEIPVPSGKTAAVAQHRPAAARVASVASMPSVDLNTGEAREVKEQPTFPDDPMRAKSLVDDSTPPMSRLPLELILRDVADNADAAKDLIQNKFRVWWPKLYAWADPRVFVAVVLRHVDLMKASA